MYSSFLKIRIAQSSDTFIYGVQRLIGYVVLTKENVSLVLCLCLQVQPLTFSSDLN